MAIRVSCDSPSQIYVPASQNQLQVQFIEVLQGPSVFSPEEMVVLEKQALKALKKDFNKYKKAKKAALAKNLGNA